MLLLQFFVISSGFNLTGCLGGAPHRASYSISSLFYCLSSSARTLFSSMPKRFFYYARGLLMVVDRESTRTLWCFSRNSFWLPELVSVSLMSWLVDSEFSSSICFLLSSMSRTSMSEFLRFVGFGDVGSTSSLVFRRQLNLFKRLFQPTKNITSMTRQNLVS